MVIFQHLQGKVKMAPKGQGKKRSALSDVVTVSKINLAELSFCYLKLIAQIFLIVKTA